MLTPEQITAVVSVVVLLLLRREVTRIVSAVDKIELIAYRVESLERQQVVSEGRLQTIDTRITRHSDELHALSKAKS